MSVIYKEMYSYSVIFFLVLIWFLHMILKKKRFVKGENAQKSSQNFIKKHEKKINIIITIIISSGLIFFAISHVVPVTLDLPYVIHDDYIMTQGIVTKIYASDSRDAVISIQIQEFNTDKYINFYIPSDDTLEIGKIVYAKYLPHSKYGVILFSN